MKVDLITPNSPDRTRMNWFRAEHHIAMMGKQAWQATNDMDLLTVLKLDEAAWRFINQFESDVNRRHLRHLYELNSGQPKPEDWNMTPIQLARKAAIVRADTRFAQANADFLNDSWYEEADAEG